MTIEMPPTRYYNVIETSIHKQVHRGTEKKLRKNKKSLL